MLYLAKKYSVTPTPNEKDRLNAESFVLLAEDDVDDQELLMEALNALDKSLRFHVVNNGKKAITYLDTITSDKIPCLIILDYNLPEFNGAEILKRMNANPDLENVTKIVWSTSNSPVYEQICLDLGAKAYLVKPNDIAGINDLALYMLHLCHSNKEL